MLKFNRQKDNKWVLQKNISSKKLFDSYIEALSKQKNELNITETLKILKENKVYKGRSEDGNKGTLGVRLSQMCFYMFGYKDNRKEKFIPSISTQISKNGEKSLDKIFLINLFSMQYPHPYSKTPSNFNIFIGRLLIKLLLDKRLDNKLYIDESIWFLPFIESINKEKYEELILKILEYRELCYEEKLKKFKSIKNYDDIFSNCLHEMKYYFFKIFSEFKVLELVSEKQHNSGKLFKFKHGMTPTLRNDSVGGLKNSGYIKLYNNIIDSAQILSENFSAFEKPLKESDCLNLNDWIKILYQSNMLDYFSTIDNYNIALKELNSICQKMLYESKYGSNDGKSFEESLKPCFELFREVWNVQIYSGAGNTDLLCNVKIKDEFKVNVDAKKTKNRLSAINPRRIESHQNKHGSDYSIIVAPKFSKGSKLDIEHKKIVLLEAETLASYFMNECSISRDGYADFRVVDSIIRQNYGIDLTEKIEDLMIERYRID